MPTIYQVGEYPNVYFDVTDGIHIDFENITIVVYSDNQPPILDPISDLAVDGEAAAEEEVEKPTVSFSLIIHHYEEE